ncbi:hypothetical protein CGMCC3_g16784 [Colletotrichum fructicola]|nr:uncharacterized protein CGMCC3_g16784 [Colletotrichum fructicola]KAE9567064.1 hypothetical protein CGMCC3_g16784 [Colletotrichum fructicola]KAF4411399.1 hypothetical protein CFRS1_v006175 [Colletotrichum fructicola]KAF5482724.1 hypothetical protein CGCF413_v015601 [Colletotrichum fructicola]
MSTDAPFPTPKSSDLCHRRDLDEFPNARKTLQPARRNKTKEHWMRRAGWGVRALDLEEEWTALEQANNCMAY